jgi:hypothetical protein
MRAQQRLTQRIHKLAHRKAKKGKICNAAADPSRADTQTTVNCREQAWLLKNSLTQNLQKLDRVRKLYKRFFLVSWTFSITRFSTFFRKTDFFNSHRRSRK